MTRFDFHKSELVFPENVSNLRTHDNHNTYQVIYEKLSSLYDVQGAIISLRYFGILQHRNRIYTVAKNFPVHFPAV
ncbi:DNA cytosine methyltransferase [Phocaeicola sp.]|uniref:DNA cytosine methyltransferase n=1 Tax=Phocaeicola sp. TaxID=2773926 RepID=UPI0023BE7C46|nr:DNA cytosine methyltransferase [Phocaeicola sp.]MDE5677833.1 DNA cytosine methyltransferase [Phocaeicola sp.]